MLALLLPSAFCQAQHASRSHPTSKLAVAADITIREGVHASLPPHISTLLGVANEQECPVMQNVVRSRNEVQGLNVSLKDKHDIVLFLVDEGSRDQVFYLSSPAGTLRRVVSVKAGVGQAERVTEERKKSFQKEKQFWVDRLVTHAATM